MFLTTPALTCSHRLLPTVCMHTRVSVRILLCQLTYTHIHTFSYTRKMAQLYTGVPTPFSPLRQSPPLYMGVYTAFPNTGRGCSCLACTHMHTQGSSAAAQPPPAAQHLLLQLLHFQPNPLYRQKLSKHFRLVYQAVQEHFVSSPARPSTRSKNVPGPVLGQLCVCQ